MSTATEVVNIRLGEKCDVFIGRPSKWGNPFRSGRDGSLQLVLAKYKLYVRRSKTLMAALSELRGKRLGCFCAPRPCHGDMLIELIEEIWPDDLCEEERL
jgi:hypothetical protein